MLRVAQQEKEHRLAWEAFIAGHARKNETFEKYTRRVGAEARTPPSAEGNEAERAATINAVKSRLGGFYRSPAQA